MNFISKYNYSDLYQNINSYQENYISEYNDEFINDKKNPFNINSKNSLFNQINQNIDTNDNYNYNFNDYNFYKEMNKPLSNRKEKKYISKSSESDLNMMKIQLRCDIISQRINQIKNQVQTFNEESHINNITSLNKNRAYGNLNESNIKKLNTTRDYINKINNIDKNNYFKIPLPNPKGKRLRKNYFAKNNIYINESLHNISCINKNMDYNNIFINQNVKNRSINNYKNFRNTFSYNTNNQRQKLSKDNESMEYNDLFKDKIKSNSKIIKLKSSITPKINNYINISNYDSKNLYNLVSNPSENNNNNKNKLLKKSKILLNNFTEQRSKSNKISPNKNKRKIDSIIKRDNNNINENSLSRYGSFDKYFFNYNNYSDKSYIKYINLIKNNFNKINYKNLDLIKQNSFNDNKDINDDNFIIQKGNNLHIINNNSKVNQKIINRPNNRNENKIINNKINKTFNSVYDKNNYINRVNKLTNYNSINKYNNKNKEKFRQYKKDKNNNMQINNNFNVNNNTNYYNFNYNQNNNNKINRNKVYNNRNNLNKKYSIEQKNVNNQFYNKQNNKIKKNELFPNKIEEISANDNINFNHDYSNDDLIHTSDMFNSINDGTNFEFIKRPSNIFQNNIRTKKIIENKINVK